MIKIKIKISLGFSLKIKNVIVTLPLSSFIQSNRNKSDLLITSFSQSTNQKQL